MTTQQILQPTLEQWAALEEHYTDPLYNGSAPKMSISVSGDKGGIFIFTAPHAVNHVREGQIKFADRGTGGLAELLALSSGNLALTADGPLDHDPNWDESAEIPFKKKLLSLLKPDCIVIDLHGMKDKYGVDISIGLGPAANVTSKSLAETMQSSFMSIGLKVAVDWPFDGRRPGTITSFVQGNGFSGIQVEIAASLRYPKVSSHDATRLINGFLSSLGAFQ